MIREILRVTTPDGVQPVERFGKPGRTGVIVYMDGFGVRDELRTMCARFADMGHTTYLPNMYYRQGGPSFAPPNKVEDTSPAGARELNKATTVEMSVSDTAALLAAESPIKWAAVGYCMGGRHAIAAAAVFPDKFAGCLSLHGGNMIDQTAWSCEKQILKLKAELFLGFAKDDPSCPEGDKAKLRAAMAAAGVAGTAKDYDAEHGWSFPDRHCYDEGAAEDVWRIAEDMLIRRLAA